MSRIVIVILIYHHQKPIDSLNKFSTFYLKYTNHVVSAVREIIAVCYDNHSKTINENSDFWMLNQVGSKKKNSMVWVREWTILTERPSDCQPLWIEGATWSAWRIPRPYSRFSRQEPLLFYQVAPQLYSRGSVDPVPDPLLFFFLVVPGIEPGPPDL
jgi:hypothetical protein